MTDVATAEMLWQRAHEHLRRSDFANAVRDLANCFQILQAIGDPRIYEVHKRWTEVYAMYLEDGQRTVEPAQDKAPSLQAEAESAANAGDLDRAIILYEQIAARSPANELVAERLAELRAAKKRVAELTGPPAPCTSENDWSDVSMDEPSLPTECPTAGVPTAGRAAERETAPAMAPEDAPIGMQSLDVPFSVGEAIDSFSADDPPVVGNASVPPQGASAEPDTAMALEAALAATAAPAAPAAATAASERASTSREPNPKPGSNGVSDHVRRIALLEDLLKRVERNRRQAG